MLKDGQRDRLAQLVAGFRPVDPFEDAERNATPEAYLQYARVSDPSIRLRMLKVCYVERDAYAAAVSDPSIRLRMLKGKTGSSGGAKLRVSDPSIRLRMLKGYSSSVIIPLWMSFRPVDPFEDAESPRAGRSDSARADVSDPSIRLRMLKVAGGIRQAGHCEFQTRRSV